MNLVVPPPRDFQWLGGRFLEPPPIRSTLTAVLSKPLLAILIGRSEHLQLREYPIEHTALRPRHAGVDCASCRTAGADRAISALLGDVKIAFNTRRFGELTLPRVSANSARSRDTALRVSIHAVSHKFSD